MALSTNQKNIIIIVFSLALGLLFLFPIIKSFVHAVKDTSIKYNAVVPLMNTPEIQPKSERHITYIDTVYLKKGDKIEGNINYQDDKYLYIDIEAKDFPGCYNSFAIDKQNIKKCIIRQIEGLEYKIANTEDVSTKVFEKPASLYTLKELDMLPIDVRKKYRIIVPQNISDEELKYVFMQIIIDESLRDPDIDEITIFAYNNENDLNGAYTSGKVHWGPNNGLMTSEIATTNDRTFYQYDFDIKNRKKDVGVSIPISNPQSDFEQDVRTHSTGIKDCIIAFQQEGLIINMERNNSKVYVNPSLWKSCEYTLKHKIAIAMLRYYALTNNEYNAPFVDIYDGYSGKKIAAVSSIGFDNYE